MIDNINKIVQRIQAEYPGIRVEKNVSINKHFIASYILIQKLEIKETELVVFRGSIYDIQNNCAKILKYLTKDKCLKISARRTFRSGGIEMKELNKISKEIEKRLKLKDQIDSLIGKLKNQPQKNLSNDVAQLIKLKDKQFKLVL